MKILLIFASLLAISFACLDEGKCWMKRVPGDKTINKMSIPGTHDSMTYTVEILTLCKAQTLDLNQQLEAGVRFFDIRLKLELPLLGGIPDDLYLEAYHGSNHFASCALEIVFTEIMNIFDTFLKTYPSEAIIFRYKNEDRASYSDSLFCQVFDDVLLQHREKIWNYHQGSTVHSLGSNYPALSEIRGKMVILQVNSDCFGFKFDNLTLDNFNGGDGTNPFTNQPYVTQMVQGDKASTEYKNELTSGLKSTCGKSELTFIFASAVVTLKLWPEGFAEDVNPHLESFLMNNKYLDNLGVVVFDYITDFTPDLPRLIFKRNYEDKICATFYEHRNFGGNSFNHIEGRTWMGHFTEINSFRVKTGCTVHLTERAITNQKKDSEYNSDVPLMAENYQQYLHLQMKYEVKCSCPCPA